MSAVHPIALTKSQRLIALEKIIEGGKKAFIEVGNALATVRDEFKHDFEAIGYKNFEDYCKQKWGISRRSAYDLMDTSEAAQNVQDIAQPKNRESLRPLVSLEPEQQREVYAAAVEASPTGQPTAKEVQAAVDEVVAPERAERVSYTPANGLQYAQMAIDNLSKIQPTDTQKTRAFQKVKNWIAQQEKQYDQS